MAQSFKAASLSLGEAERTKSGHEWGINDYERHKKEGYKIDENMTKENTVLISVGGRSERDVVNDFFEKRMIELNEEKRQKTKEWNEKNVGHINKKTGKEYRKRSTSKNQLFPVGKDVGRGTRNLPFETFKNRIELGNARAKNPEKRHRSNVLQQFIVGFGNREEWQNDAVRKQIYDGIHNKDENIRNQYKKVFENSYVKPFLDDFRKNNPSMPLVQAVVQYDETNPHLHFTVLPHHDGKQSGGLGTVGYTTCLKADHPEGFKEEKSNIVDGFYKHENEVLRDIIKNAEPFKGQKMSLNPNRPGSHKDMRVNEWQKMQDEKAKTFKWAVAKQTDFDRKFSDLSQYKAVVDKNNEIAKNNYQLAENRLKSAKSVENSNKIQKQQINETHENVQKVSNYLRRVELDTIKAIQPEHVVPIERLPRRDVTPKRIDTKEGYEQHAKQPFGWIHNVANELLTKTVEAYQNWRKTMQERERKAKEREQSIKKREDEVKKRESKAKLIDVKEHELKQRENNVQGLESQKKQLDDRQQDIDRQSIMIELKQKNIDDQKNEIDELKYKTFRFIYKPEKDDFSRQMHKEQLSTKTNQETIEQLGKLDNFTKRNPGTRPQFEKMAQDFKNHMDDEDEKYNQIDQNEDLFDEDKSKDDEGPEL